MDALDAHVIQHQVSFATVLDPRLQRDAAANIDGGWGNYTYHPDCRWGNGEGSVRCKPKGGLFCLTGHLPYAPGACKVWPNRNHYCASGLAGQRPFPPSLGDKMSAGGSVERDLHSLQQCGLQSLISEGHNQVDRCARRGELLGGAQRTIQGELGGAAIVGDDGIFDKLSHGAPEEALHSTDVGSHPTRVSPHQHLQMQMRYGDPGASRMPDELACAHWTLARLRITQVGQTYKPISLYDHLHIVAEIRFEEAFISQEVGHAIRGCEQGGPFVHGKVERNPGGFAIRPVSGRFPGDSMALATRPG